MKRPNTAPTHRLMLYIGRFFVILLTVVLAVVLLLAGGLKMICSQISPSAEKVFVTTILETGQLKFLASLFLSPSEIQAIVDSNSLEDFNDPVDSSMIAINVGSSKPDGGTSGSGAENNQDIEIEKISGRTFYATLLIVKDPSRLSIASIFPWRERGVTLDELVKSDNAKGGINAGIYNSTNNTGGSPYGVVVSKGEIQYNEPQLFQGLVLIGLTEDNILQIVDINGYSKAQTAELIKTMNIRDAITFQEESTDANNHFVQLVINGVAREMNGMGSGLNPRTAIGQRADGALLLLVTDGRGRSGHLGASASDLIDIMMQYGAVNAANLDGGSSSCMYYQDEYLMDSVTFYYTNSSWRMPTAFVIH